ncbi:MAG: glycosidase [Chloroflexi bacterium]|nr:glycosidase [Chloroflexota bacterium]
MAESLFTRSPRNPILTPGGHWWESRAVLNPGVVLHEGRVILVYRAVGGDGLSRFGLAWSRDGEEIEGRLNLPFYEGALDDPFARLGVEDPRITMLDGCYYFTYCKASVEVCTTPPLHWEFAPFRVRSGVGVTQDFDVLREVGTILPDTNTKDSVLFPERIDGRFAALIREFPSIQYATSEDLVSWSDPVPVMEPVPGTWEGERIGAGPPPIPTPWGWLLVYHGNEYFHRETNHRLYRTGLALLDADEPWKVLYRHPEPIFSPEAPYEIEGPVGNVVFAIGLVEIGDRFYLYYGAGDGVIGVATADREAVFDLIRRGLPAGDGVGQG